MMKRTIQILLLILISLAGFSQANVTVRSVNIDFLRLKVDSVTIAKGTGIIKDTLIYWYNGNRAQSSTFEAVDNLTTVGNSFVSLTNPSAVTWPRINADNTVTALSASATLSAIGGQAAITTTSSILTGADVTMTTAGTWYTGTSITLGAGTYLLTAQILVGHASTALKATGRIFDGSNSVSSGTQQIPSAGDREATVTLTALVSPAGSTTYSIQATSSLNTSFIKYQTSTTSQPAATQIIALKIL